MTVLIALKVCLTCIVLLLVSKTWANLEAPRELPEWALITTGLTFIVAVIAGIVAAIGFIWS